MDWLGVIEMLVAAALYALHLPINQRVLYDMPAPTVTLYTLIAMSIVVFPAFLISGTRPEAVDPKIVVPLLGLTLVTFLSRLMLFTGVKHLGGMQTALLGLKCLL
jgi:drug/metabolite transporter (DMT)-like permease